MWVSVVIVCVHVYVHVPWYTVSVFVNIHQAFKEPTPGSETAYRSLEQSHTKTSPLNVHFGVTALKLIHVAESSKYG